MPGSRSAVVGDKETSLRGHVLEGQARELLLKCRLIEVPVDQGDVLDVPLAVPGHEAAHEKADVFEVGLGLGLSDLLRARLSPGHVACNVTISVGGGRRGRGRGRGRGGNVSSGAGALSKSFCGPPQRESSWAQASSAAADF